MHLYVKTLVGACHTYDVESNDTIMNLMTKINDKQGIPVEQQRIIFNIKPAAKQLCPRGTFSFYKIKDGCTLHLVLRLPRCADHRSTFITNISTESLCWWNIHYSILTNKSICVSGQWDINLSKIIFELASPIDLQVMSLPELICYAWVDNKKNICDVCNRPFRRIPFIDSNKIVTYVDKYIRWDGNDEMERCYYGLYIKFEFDSLNEYHILHMKSDIVSMIQNNMETFIEIVDLSNQIVLKYELCGIDEVDSKQIVTIQIDFNCLKQKYVKELFENNKLKVNIIIHENKLCKNNNKIIDDTKLEHCIYLIS